MLANILLESKEKLLPASHILPGLGREFDISTESDLLSRFQAIQSKAPSPYWSYRTSEGSAISLFHDTPLIEHSDLCKARYLFPEGTNGFRDQIVVDLGAGRLADGYLLARDFGARAYIAVDFCFAPMLAKSINELAPRERTIPCAIVYDSIEQVLPAVPKRSVSFICSGIDDTLPGFDKLHASITQYVPDRLHEQGALLLYTPVYEKFRFPELRNVSELHCMPVWAL